MSILINIQRIKIIASCLFFIPLVALFFSLFLNNHLVVYHPAPFPISKMKFGELECNKINNFCNYKWLLYKYNPPSGKTRNFTDCNKFKFYWNFYTLVKGKRMIMERKEEAIINAVKEEMPFFLKINENKNEINKHLY